MICNHTKLLKESSHTELLKILYTSIDGLHKREKMMTIEKYLYT